MWVWKEDELSSLFKKKKVLSGAQTQFSSPWKVFLGALCSEAPEARADPLRMGQKTDPISLLIWVQLRGDNCRKNVHKASWEVLRRPVSLLTPVMPARGVGGRLRAPYGSGTLSHKAELFITTFPTQNLCIFHTKQFSSFLWTLTGCPYNLIQI